MFCCTQNDQASPCFCFLSFFFLVTIVAGSAATSAGAASLCFRLDDSCSVDVAPFPLAALVLSTTARRCVFLARSSSIDVTEPRGMLITLSFGTCSSFRYAVVGILSIAACVSNRPKVCSKVKIPEIDGPTTCESCICDVTIGRIVWQIDVTSVSKLMLYVLDATVMVLLFPLLLPLLLLLLLLLFAVDSFVKCNFLPFNCATFTSFGNLIKKNCVPASATVRGGRTD